MKTSATPTTKTTRTSYKTFVDRLKAGGLVVSRSADGPRVALSSLSFAPPGHLLQHPRAEWPIDRAMVEHIKANGVQKEVVVFEVVLDEKIPGTSEYKRALYVLGGARRRNHAMVAEREMRAEGLLDEPMMIKFRLFEGTQPEALMEMLADNSDSLKEADAPSILAFLVTRLLKLGVSMETIAAKMPKGIGLAEVEALSQWSKLLPEVAARFDAGAPIGLLAAVVAVPESKQMETLDKLLGAKVTTSKGATRTLRKETAQKGGGTGERLHPRRVAKVIAAIGTPAAGSPADWFLKGILFVEGKLDLAELPADLRTQVLTVIKASAKVDTK